MTHAKIRCEWLLLASTLEQDPGAFAAASEHLKAAERLLQELDQQVTDRYEPRPHFKKLAELRDTQRRIKAAFAADHLNYVYQRCGDAQKQFDEAWIWYRKNDRELIRKGLMALRPAVATVADVSDPRYLSDDARARIVQSLQVAKRMLADAEWHAMLASGGFEPRYRARADEMASGQ